MTVGEKIYALRTQAGYSQEEFAELVGVSRQSVSKWETSVAIPDTEYVVKICKILSVSADTLLMDGDLPIDKAGTLQIELQQEADISNEATTTQQAAETTSRALTIVGFVFSFIFGIVGLIVSCLALKREQRPIGEINHLAVSGVAVSSAKIYATVAFAVVYGILYSIYGG